MPNLNVRGYTAAFQSFVDFANAPARSEKAVARLATEDLSARDGERTVTNITTTTTDKAFAFRRSRADKNANDATRSAFLKAVSDMFGGEKFIPESVRKAMLMKDYNCGKPLTARRIAAVQKAIDKYNFDTMITGDGSGPVKELMKNPAIYGATPSSKRREFFAGRMNDIAKASVATGITQQMSENLRVFDSKTNKAIPGSENLDSTGTVFYKDLARDSEIYLPDGRRLPKDFELARDMLTQFVTGDANAKFLECGDKVKKQVLILQSCMCQAAQGMIISSFSAALDPQCSQEQVGFLESPTEARDISYSLVKTDDGEIKVQIRSRLPLNMVIASKPGGKTANIMCKPGDFVQLDMDISFTRDELDKLGNAEWKTFDYSPVRKIENDRTMTHRKLQMADALPKELKFEGKVDVAVKLHMS